MTRTEDGGADPPGKPHGSGSQERDTDDAPAAASADVRLVDCRGLTPDGVRRALAKAASALEGPNSPVGVIDASGLALEAALDAGVSYVVDRGVTDPAQLAAVARAGTVVIVAARSSMSTDEAVLEARNRHDAVMAGGAPAAAVVLELPVGASRSAVGVAARGAGTPLGVAVEAPGVRQGLDAIATVVAGDDSERGRSIGMLTADLVAGVATVRTADPRIARRVRAVVARLVGARIAEGDLDQIEPPGATPAATLCETNSTPPVSARR